MTTTLLRELLGIHPRWLVYVVLVAVLGGVFFRVYNLDRKVYWDDEIFTSLRVIGYTEADWIQRSYGVTDAAGMRELLHPTAPQRPVFATVNGLATEEPQHAPVYYVAAHYWGRAFGNSTAALRSLSAVIGLLALPAAFWLCVELFGTALAGWIGVALVATSPLLVLYSQEAREYSLWALVIFLMGASFLRAARLRSIGAWALYAAVFTFGLYVYPLCAFLALGQAVYIAVLERSRPRELLYPALAMLAGILCFLPWLRVMMAGSEQIHRAMATVTTIKRPAFHIVREFLGNFRLNFIDFNVFKPALLDVALSLPVIALVAYALYFLCRHATPRVWGYIVATIVVTTLPVVVPDLMFAGDRTGNVRYFFPLFVSVDLAIVYLLYTKLSSGVLQQARIWQAVFVAILAVRIASCAVSSQADTWWNKLDEKSISVAHVINGSHHPLLISDNYIDFALSLSDYLDPTVRVELRPHCYLSCGKVADDNVTDARVIQHGNEIGEVFLLGPSPQLQKQVREASLDHRVSGDFRCIDVRHNCTSALSLW